MHPQMQYLGIRPLLSFAAEGQFPSDGWALCSSVIGAGMGTKRQAGANQSNPAQWMPILP
jgi:hypothetical protein